MHRLIAANKSSKALGTDRRDDMRYNLRAKLANKDYVGKDMKQYHYSKANGGVGGPNGASMMQS